MLTPEQIARSGTESAHQTALFAWVALNQDWLPELKLLFAIPNGGLRNKVTAARMKAEGVRAGVPDLFLPVARRQCHGLFIEMKVGKNTLSSAQEDWRDRLWRQNYECVVCYSWLEAASFLETYLTTKGELA